MKTIRIGTRDSHLALWQAKWVQSILQKLYPKLEFLLIPMKTKGDKILDVPLAKIGDKGLFTKELENGLLRSEIDLAVHSLKDLPTLLPQGLDIAVYCKREEARDVFLSKDGTRLQDLPPGALIGTSSLRRKAQLKYFRPDFSFIDVRGNLQTRWQKLQDSEMAGIVLAGAGVMRMEWHDRITQFISEDIVLSAVGQGSIALEIAQDRTEIRALLTPLNHVETERAVRAERALMQELEGGCQIPIGALGSLDHENIRLQGIVADLDGTRLIRAVSSGRDPEEVGIRTARLLLAKGAGDILRELR